MRRLSKCLDLHTLRIMKKKKLRWWKIKAFWIFIEQFSSLIIYLIRKNDIILSMNVYCLNYQSIKTAFQSYIKPFFSLTSVIFFTYFFAFWFRQVNLILLFKSNYLVKQFTKKRWTIKQSNGLNHIQSIFLSIIFINE